MKQTTQNIKKLLENEAYKSNLENLNSKQGTFTAIETSISEAYEKILDIMNILEESIDKGILDELPFTTRNQIYSQLNNALRYSNNAQQFLTHFNTLAHHMSLTPLYWRVAEDENMDSLIKELNTLKRKYKKTLKDVSEAEESKNQLAKLKLDVDSQAEYISGVILSAEKLDESLKLNKGEIDQKVQLINNAAQEIENNKKGIIAFSSNIEKTEDTIKNIQNDLKVKTEEEIEDRIKKAKELITQAEKALLLKETEGISSAMIGRLDKLTNSRAKELWLVGAVFFVLLTTFLGYLLTGGVIEIGSFKLGYTDTEKIGFVLGRIVVALIGITAAVFCSKQYLNLKNIEEDYEYKVVLTKSILAFSNKIKEIDKEKVAEYLTTVLSEIHQDPLRSRKKEKTTGITSGHLKELVELIKSIPKGG